MATSTSIGTTDAAVETAEAECPKGIRVGLFLIAHVTEIDFEESELVDDRRGDGDEEEEERGDEEEEDAEVVKS